MAKMILVVDDDPEVREVLIDIFTEMGYLAEGAGDPWKAMEKVMFERPDLLIIDTDLPGMGGIELCRVLKKDKALPIKAIVYTGKIDAINAVAARRAGADDYCVKGESPSLLLEAVKRLLGEAG
jgi:DNA-binding response OmpR family regulator